MSDTLKTIGYLSNTLIQSCHLAKYTIFYNTKFLCMHFFYNAMHFGTKSGIEIAYCPSVCLSVRDVAGSGAHRLEILESNCTDNWPALCSPKAIHIPHTPRGTWGNFGETRGGVGKSGVLKHKSGNISETRKDRDKVTMESL